MSSWDTELREVIAEQMYLLRKETHIVPVSWRHLRDGQERQSAYRDADRILALVVVREVCLRDDLERETQAAESWQRRFNGIAAQTVEWRDRAMAAEAELSAMRERLGQAERNKGSIELVRKDALRLAVRHASPPMVGRYLDVRPAEMQVDASNAALAPAVSLDRQVSSDVALIEDAVNVFRALLAPPQEMAAGNV